MIQVALNVMAAQQSVPDAFATPRVYAGAPGNFFVEPGAAKGDQQVTELPSLGAVNVVMCPSGLPIEAPDCVAQTDPRALGVTQSFKSPAPYRAPQPIFPREGADPSQ
jgi:hypothetical protein